MPTISGDNGPNALAGSSDADLIKGLGGRDTLAGFGGFDTLQGGAGSDTADFSWSDTDVSVDLSQGREFNENVALLSIENAIGGSADDVLLGEGGRNRLAGGDGGDSLDGGGGDDKLSGDDGNDTLEGGEGFDQARYDLATAAVVVDLAAGTAAGGAGVDDLRGIEAAVGSAFGDDVAGTDGANLLRGRGGDDTLSGFGGFDTLRGGGGSDTADFSWSDTDVSVDLAAGLEFNGNVALFSIESAIGGSADDVLLGDADGNRLEGGGGGDVIDGREGDDTLVGGTGSDTLAGGAGADLFIFALGDGTDVINDFEVGVDRIAILQVGTAGLNIAASGDDAVISFGGGNVIRLVGVAAAELTPDFILA